MSSPRECSKGGNWGLAGVGLVAFMISCCVAGPLLIVGLATLSGVALLEAGVGVFLAITLVWIVVSVVQSRRRGACDFSLGKSTTGDRNAQREGVFQ